MSIATAVSPSPLSVLSMTLIWCQGVQRFPVINIRSDNNTASYPRSSGTPIPTLIQIPTLTHRTQTGNYLSVILCDPSCLVILEPPIRPTWGESFCGLSSPGLQLPVDCQGLPVQSLCGGLTRLSTINWRPLMGASRCHGRNVPVCQKFPVKVLRMRDLECVPLERSRTGVITVLAPVGDAHSFILLCPQLLLQSLAVRSMQMDNSLTHAHNSYLELLATRNTGTVTPALLPTQTIPPSGGVTGGNPGVTRNTPPRCGQWWVDWWRHRWNQPPPPPATMARPTDVRENYTYAPGLNPPPPHLFFLFIWYLFFYAFRKNVLSNKGKQYSLQDFHIAYKGYLI